MHSIIGLSTNSAITAVENKISDVSSLIKKMDYNTKISEIENKINEHNHDKYITTPKFNTLAARVFNARLAQEDLVTKRDFDAKLKKISSIVTSKKLKHLLVENEVKKLNNFDAAYFWGRNCFEGNDGTQNSLVFLTMSKYFVLRVNQVSEWKSKGLSNQPLKHQCTVGDTVLSKAITPSYIVFKNGTLFYQNKNNATIGGRIVNMVYRTSLKTISSSNALKNCLFGAIKKKKSNHDPEKIQIFWIWYCI